MSTIEQQQSPSELRQEQIDRYWAGDLARKTYLFRKQRKAILENCRRVAVVGVSADPNSPSYIAVERLLGLGLEVIPVFPGRESLLGLRCFGRLCDVPGKVDIVQVYPHETLDYELLAREAVVKAVDTVWFEPGLAASKTVEETLINGRVHLVEYENLETEYLKHMPYSTGATIPRKDKKGAKVRDRMSRNPATVKPDDGLKDAMWKMEHGHFRHLPVVDDQGKLIGMLTDRDIRSIQPSSAFVSKDDAAVQLWSISVQQAAVFDPITVKPDHSLREAAEIMLRWHVGGLPVVEEHDRLVGMITYTDILREFVGRDEAR